jgi:UDP-2-acetamido-3-amino-2,3-dideoxy-glucuronate N-acetyltransferase
MNEYFIHPSAIADKGSTIGNNTYIWHFSHIMPGAVIGTNCIIGQNVFIGNGVLIGDGVKIQNNVSLYNGVSIEDDVFIGPSAVFTNVINPRSFVERKNEFKKTLICRGASIGANATIICGVQIGKFSMIGAGSVATKSFPDYSLAYGNPAVRHGWVSKKGYSLVFNDMGEAICKGTGEPYFLYRDNVQPATENL